VALVEPERTSVITRVRYELGFSAVGLGGLPYLDHAFIPDKSIDNLTTGSETSSITEVTAASVQAGTPTTITLASGVGFATMMKAHVDAGPRREIVTFQFVSGTAATAVFKQPHLGTYTVEADGGVPMLRTILGILDKLAVDIDDARASAAVKKIDTDIEFFPSEERQLSRVTELEQQRDHWRGELASLLQLPRGLLTGGQRRAATRVEVF